MASAETAGENEASLEPTPLPNDTNAHFRGQRAQVSAPKPGREPGAPGGSLWAQTFSYDAFGNIKKSGNSAFAPTYPFTSGATTNQFFSIPGVTVSYDANGNLLTDNLNSYSCDKNWGSMLSVTTGSATVTAIYDALGRMVENNSAGVNNGFIYSPTGAKVATVNGTTLVKAWIALPGGATAVYNSSGLAYYRHSDWLGSSRLTSTQGRVLYSSSAYAPFGEQYAASGTTDASFTGQDQTTVSNLYDFTFRRSSPSQGRWISPDPLGTGAAVLENPQSWNRYTYVSNNPLSFVDPLGLAMSTCQLLDNCTDDSSVGGGGISPFCPECGSDGFPPGPIGAGRGGGGGGTCYYVLLDPCGGTAANNGTPKSPARQRCEQKAQQQFQQAKSAAATNAFTAAKYTFFITEGFNAAAGCAIGAGVGAAFGTTVAEFTGGTSSFGGAGVGCFTGGVDMALNGLAPAALWGAVGGTVSYLVDRNAAKNDYNQAMQACSQIP